MIACGVDRGAEVEPAGRHAADHAGLGGQRQQVDDLLLGRDVGDAFRHADAEVDDAVGLELERRAAGDDLALAHRHAAASVLIGTRISPAKAGL